MWRRFHMDFYGMTHDLGGMKTSDRVSTMDHEHKRGSLCKNRKQDRLTRSDMQFQNTIISHAQRIFRRLKVMKLTPPFCTINLKHAGTMSQGGAVSSICLHEHNDKEEARGRAWTRHVPLCSSSVENSCLFPDVLLHIRNSWVFCWISAWNKRVTYEEKGSSAARNLSRTTRAQRREGRQTWASDWAD